jgi:hypothetical protein
MFKFIVRVINTFKTYRQKTRTYLKNLYLKAIGKDPAFDPNELEWHLGPYVAKTRKMQSVCLKMLLGKYCIGEMRTPTMAPTESSMVFDADSVEGSTINVKSEEFGNTRAMTFRNGTWAVANYAGCPECLVSDHELPFINKEPMKMHDAYTAAYETKTKPVLAMIARYYEDNKYLFRNVCYRANELQSVIIGFALGRLPLGFFKYTEGNGYTSIVPSKPADGAEIVTMPNYETFATYRNGIWEIQMDITAREPDCIPASSKLVPYIAGIRTVTCVYEVAYEEREAKDPAKLAVSFGVGYTPASHKKV